MRMTTGMGLMMAAVLGSGMVMGQTAPAGSAAGSSMADAPNINADPTTKGVYPSDNTFVKKAIMGNNGEIDAAKLALQKSQNQQVKDFAQKMVDDHTKMADSLKQIAQQDNIKFEDKPSPAAMKLHAKLEGLDGAAFDKAYVNGMVKDHKEDVREFSTEINHGKKQDVKDAASSSLPTIKEHLTMIEGIQKGM